MAKRHKIPDKANSKHAYRYYVHIIATKTAKYIDN